MKKMILAFLVSSMILLLNSSVSLAAICSTAPDGVHHFDAHRRMGAGYSVDKGTHKYLYGYIKVDDVDVPIYRDDCVVKDNYEYCDIYCIYCGKVEMTHTEFASTSHSVFHM